MAQNDSNTAAPADDDLFGRPTRSAFPKLEELEGRLLLIHPTKIEHGIKSKYGEQSRVTADIAVLDDPDEGVREIDKMYLSQKGMVGMLETCLKPGKKPFVLGRLVKSPASDYADAAEKAGDGDATAGINKLLEDWLRKGGKGEKPAFFWNLADFTDHEANMARRYLSELDQFDNAAT